VSCSGNKAITAPIILDVMGVKSEILSRSSDSDTLIIYLSGAANCPKNQGGSVFLFSKNGISTEALLFSNNNRIDTVNSPLNFPWRYISENWNNLELDTINYSFQGWPHYTYDEIFIQMGSDTLTCYIEMADWHTNESGAKVILNEKLQAMLYRNRK
jgi:hypothetical protein